MSVVEHILKQGFENKEPRVKDDKIPSDRPPWWVWVIISIGLAESSWFAKMVIEGGQQSAVTSTEIKQIQTEQSALTISLTTLDTDVQTLNVNVAVLSQQIKDTREGTSGH